MKIIYSFLGTEHLLITFLMFNDHKINIWGQSSKKEHFSLKYLFQKCYIISFRKLSSTTKETL